LINHDTLRAPSPERDGAVDVCLVSMPYTDLERPSLGLSLLAAALRRAGISVAVRYPCFDMADEFGAVEYYHAARLPLESLACDWTFGTALFPDWDPPHARDRLLALARPRHVGAPEWDELGPEVIDRLAAIREETPAFVDRTARRILALRPRVVGCTSIFQQHCASLALLKRIRELDPSVATLIGGSNCEGPMGMATRRNFEFVDFVISGEADALIEPLCRRLIRGDRAIPQEQLPLGILGPESAALPRDTPPPRASVWRLDEVPVPDFDDYFEALAGSSVAERIRPGLLVEGSRGCWWGAKSHCTFCGLNGETMAFRSKSATRVLEELDTLSERYGTKRFEMVDNILDMEYFRTLLPELAGSDRNYDLFFEIKANLKRPQVEALAAAGVRQVQPGIENLHNGVLKLIGKGTTTAINLQLMKWAAELSVRLTWIMLHDVPGDRDEWYDEMAEWLPLVSHLQPPDHATPVQFHRFSPYHDSAATWGLDLEPAPGYSLAYPFGRDELEDLAYLFEDRHERPKRAAVERVVELIADWQRAYWSEDRPRLSVEPDLGGLFIRDTRPARAFDFHFLGGLEAAVYDACDAAVTPAALVRTLAERGWTVEEPDVEASLAELRRRRLVLDTAGRVLALAVRPRTDGDVGEYVGGSIDIPALVRAAGADPQ
jgi:magnesium-protoporphyrin IX monomethyl ester (oxidative) cyclase